MISARFTYDGGHLSPRYLHGGSGGGGGDGDAAVDGGPEAKADVPPTCLPCEAAADGALFEGPPAESDVWASQPTPPPSYDDELDSVPAPGAAERPAFRSSASFAGARDGYVFRAGGSGVGYYRDTTPPVSSAAPPPPAARVPEKRDCSYSSAVPPSARVSIAAAAAEVSAERVAAQRPTPPTAAVEDAVMPGLDRGTVVRIAGLAGRPEVNGLSASVDSCAERPATRLHPDCTEIAPRPHRDLEMRKLDPACAKLPHTRARVSSAQAQPHKRPV